MSDGKYKSLNLISSLAVAAFIGFDGNWVANSMENNLKTRSFDMDGFNDAVYGVSCAGAFSGGRAGAVYKACS